MRNRGMTPRDYIKEIDDDGQLVERIVQRDIDRRATRPAEAMPAFDPSNLLAAMPEPEGDREPDDEFPVDPPNDDFEGR